MTAQELIIRRVSADGLKFEDIKLDAASNFNTTLQVDGSGDLVLGPNTATGVDAAVAGAGLVENGGALDINIDGVTLDITGDVLSVTSGVFIKADGSTAMGADLSLGGNKITNLATPTADTDAANKSYVDGLVQGLDAKASVVAATDSALPAVTYDNGTAGVGATLTADANGALPTIDGVTLELNERVLVKDQASALQNGIYEVTQVGDGSNPFILTRAEDMNENFEATPGVFTFVEEGTTNADSGWVVTADATITVGTSGIVWTQFSGAGQITAGDGLSKTGNLLDVIVAPDGLTINGSNQIALNVDSNALVYSTNALTVNADTTRGLAIDASGVYVDISSTGGLEFTTGALNVKLDPAANRAGLVSTVDGLGIDATTLYVDPTFVAATYGANDLNTVLESLDTAINNINTAIGGLTSDAIVEAVTQVGHTLTVGEVVRKSGGLWVEAQANSAVNSEALGIVSSVSGDDIEITLAGKITGLSGLSADTVYYLSAATPGLLTATAPTGEGEIYKAMLYADSTTTGYVLNYIGIELFDGGAVSTYIEQKYTVLAGDVTAGFVTLTQTPNDVALVRVTALHGPEQSNKAWGFGVSDFSVTNSTQLNINTTGDTGLSGDITAGDELIIQYYYDV